MEEELLTLNIKSSAILNSFDIQIIKMKWQNDDFKRFCRCYLRRINSNKLLEQQTFMIDIFASKHEKCHDDTDKFVAKLQKEKKYLKENHEIIVNSINSCLHDRATQPEADSIFNFEFFIFLITSILQHSNSGYS